MIRIANSLLAGLMGLSVTLGVAPAAHAADMIGSYEEYDAGACSQAWVLNKITDRFNYQVHHVPHLPDVAITDFRHIREHRYLPASEDWPIERTYCNARVALSDGRDRTIWYMIEKGQGFASMGDNVEFCVSGFDRWLVYNGRCRVLR